MPQGTIFEFIVSIRRDSFKTSRQKEGLLFVIGRSYFHRHILSEVWNHTLALIHNKGELYSVGFINAHFCN